MHLNKENTFLFFGLLIPASMILPENTTGLVLFLFLLTTIWLFIKKEIRFSFDPYLIPFIALFSVYLISVFYSENIEEAKVKLSIKFPLLLLPILLHIYIKNTDKNVLLKLMRNLVILFATSTPYFLLIAIYRSIKSKSLYYTYPETGEIISTYFTYVGLSEWVIHPAYLSIWVGSVFLLSIYFVLNNAKIIFYIIASFSLFILLILLQSRMNILAFFAVILITFVFYLFEKYSFKFNLFILLGIAIVGTMIYRIVPESIKGRFSDLSSLKYNIEAETFHEGFNGITIRLAEWKCAFQEIGKRPLFGSGIGDARFDLESSYLRNNFKYGYREKFNAHNQFIETTLATGMVGLIALLSIFGYSFLYSYKFKKLHTLVIMLYIFLCFFTESYLERQWGVVFFCFMIPILLESEINLSIFKIKR
ncbi:O-antigen ligase family protein [Thermaurantimonas aggregans]|uniref:O-antigen ligase family protein n=1 Tax=Thermaurantimonas aggregans TaxID=2173829 RepID=UPI0023F2051A|nr:O-antigen ligase family protein [Thermaurantimonas aggregans]MCX8148798.1 O-antigen ligase family protein [Thermaurantimonas aggregans]